MKQVKAQTINDALFKLDGLSGCGHIDFGTREACAVGYRAISALKRYLDLDSKLSHDEFMNMVERDLYETQQERAK